MKDMEEYVEAIGIAQAICRDVDRRGEWCNHCRKVGSWWAKARSYDDGNLPIDEKRVRSLVQVALHHAGDLQRREMDVLRDALDNLGGYTVEEKEDLIVLSVPSRVRTRCALCEGPVRRGDGYAARLGDKVGAVCDVCYEMRQRTRQSEFLYAWRIGNTTSFIRNPNPGECVRCRKYVLEMCGWMGEHDGWEHVVCEACYDMGWNRTADPDIEPDLSHIHDGAKDKVLSHQNVAIASLQENASFLLADDMGLGKTIEALLAFPRGAPVLVVCPANVQTNWLAEAEVWRPDMKAGKIKDRKSFRWPEPGEILSARWDSLPASFVGGEQAVEEEGEKRKSGKRKGKRPPIEVVRWRGESECLRELCGDPHRETVLIMDEAHYAKSSKSQRTRNARTVSRAVKKANGKVWLLTGTPMLNRPPELWSVLRLADLHKVFHNWDHFERVFRREFKGRRRIWRGATQEARHVLRRVMLRRLADDVLALPPIRQKVDSVTLDADAMAACNDLVQWAGGPDAINRMARDAVLGGIKGEEGGALLQKLSRLRALVAAAKVPRMLELVEEAERLRVPIAVFSCHRAPIEVLESRPGWGAILGGTAADDRYEITSSFQEGELIGVAYTLAGCEGINLTRAKILIRVSMDFTPARNEQAIKRLRRIGAKDRVDVIDLVGDHQVEHIVHSALLSKERQLMAAGLNLRVDRDA